MAHATMAPMLPSEVDTMLAKEASRVFASHIANSHPMELRIPNDPSPAGMVRLPILAARRLIRILEEMARGNAVTLIQCKAIVF